MKSLAPRLTILLFPIILVLIARQSRAEMWCGDGPGTKLSHPCTDDDDNPAVSAAIEKYRDHWMAVDGVCDVIENDTYHNHAQSIVVDVDTASVDSVKKQIPASVEGIPVVIVPVKKSTSDNTGNFIDTGHFAYGPHAYGPPAQRPPIDPAELARLAAQQADQEKAEKSYALVLHQYGERWDRMPGVLGMTPKCNHNGCDFKTIEITVQKDLLSQARDEIPSSVNGVRIVLAPDDD
jgi:hypothetical protein